MSGQFYPDTGSRSFRGEESPVGGVKRGKQGVTTSGIEMSPGKRRALDKKRKRQEERWASRSGSVTTRRVEDLSEDERQARGL